MVRLFGKFVKIRRVTLTAVYEDCTLVNDLGHVYGKQIDATGLLVSEAGTLVTCSDRPDNNLTTKD